VISLTLRVERVGVEAVLDELLPLAPKGVHERDRGAEVELTFYGEEDELPAPERVEALAGGFLRELRVARAPDDWRARRLLNYEPLVVDGRVLVRPAWAPEPGDGLIDVVISHSSAFGTGTHPTTRACLEVLTEREPRGALADLGCGSVCSRSRRRSSDGPPWSPST
jgi:ribosomal protein L11 methyltransferase